MNGNGNSDPPEPFTTLSGLVNEFGFLEIVQTLAQIADARSQDVDHYDAKSRALLAAYRDGLI